MQNVRGLSNSIRTEEGDGAMAARAIVKYGQKPMRSYALRVCERRVKRAEIQKAGGVIVWIDADPKVRHDRLQAAKRGRGATDELTFEEFQQQEANEMAPSRAVVA